MKNNSSEVGDPPSGKKVSKEVGHDGSNSSREFVAEDILGKARRELSTRSFDNNVAEVISVAFTYLASPTEGFRPHVDTADDAGCNISLVRKGNKTLVVHSKKSTRDESEKTNSQN